MIDSAKAIKAMTLYQGVERVYNELRERGLEGNESLNHTALTDFDQLHYFGTDAVDDAIAQLTIGSTDTVLDIGAGFGGPARHLAATTQCQVIAVELQRDMHAAGQDLTRRTGLHDRVCHINADVLDLSSNAQMETPVHHVVSWLAFLHIPNREQLLQLCFDWLQPGGKLYFEDFHERGQFSDAERLLVQTDLYCHRLPSLTDVYRDLSKAGFEHIHVDDLTHTWAPFVRDRLAAWRSAQARHGRVHGE